jgi:hypothetical protein
MSLIIPSIVSIPALAVPPYYITNNCPYLVLGTLEQKLYDVKMLYQASDIQSTWKRWFRVYPENKGEPR